MEYITKVHLRQTVNIWWTSTGTCPHRLFATSFWIGSRHDEKGVAVGVIDVTAGEKERPSRKQLGIVSRRKRAIEEQSMADRGWGPLDDWRTTPRLTSPWTKTLEASPCSCLLRCPALRRKQIPGSFSETTSICNDGLFKMKYFQIWLFNRGQISLGF